ncbi:RNA methyltransferase, TrmH family [Bryocella elongata]|uniref:RNA methyltransferase, TrmH family n=1 Tax=Bryocella elongata TaxID=863522 RepID=A0A1H5U208_9BACT|nr:RNA methyltransferase [Bryocella elongata]SEF68297.1 RNA methyltransferase, TrmH family [Bryocella elongata]
MDPIDFGAPITSRTNARVKALRAALSGKARKPGEYIGIEGSTLILEALRSGLPLDTVFVREGSEGALDPRAWQGAEAEAWVILSKDVFDSAVETETPQGIAATMAIPPLRPLPERVGTVLLLENVQDPGNVGTLIRSGEAFGASAVFLTNDCANAWSPKVLRASAGSAFRVPMLRASLGELTITLREHGCGLLGAVAHGDGVVAVQEADLTQACAVLIGNEGAGLSQQAISACDGGITIPCEIESLNAAMAGSTILYEAMRQRLAAVKRGSSR